jgi:hypothetical protein
MKKSNYLLMAMVLLLSVFPARIIAAEPPLIIIENPKDVPVEVQVMYKRLR